MDFQIVQANDRAILHLADAIYGEAIYQISAEAKEQPIKEA